MGTAAQLTPMKGSLARGPAVWMAWARTSLPVPLSPVMSTLASMVAARRAMATALWTLGLLPTTSWKP